MLAAYRKKRIFSGLGTPRVSTMEASASRRVTLLMTLLG
jgi:hypothetical protein